MPGQQKADAAAGTGGNEKEQEPPLRKLGAMSTEPFEHGGSHGPHPKSRDYDPRDDRGYHAIIGR